MKDCGIALIFLISVLVIAEGNLSFFQQNPKPTIETLPSSVYAEGKFVAVGSNGIIVTSPDLLSWTSRKAFLQSSNVPELDFFSVCFSKLYFLAAGVTQFQKEYHIVRSLDSVIWESVYKSSYLSPLACGGDSIVVNSAEGILTSTNYGGNWTVGRKDLLLEKIIYGEAHGKFIGWRAYNQTIWSSSDEGKTWERHTAGNPNASLSFNCAAGGEEAWIMAGKNVISSNGDNLDEWTEVVSTSPGTQYPAIASIDTPQGSIYIMLQESVDSEADYHQKVLVSNNGQSWIERFDYMETPAVLSLVAGKFGERVLITGKDGLLIDSVDAGAHWLIPSGFTWETFQWSIYAVVGGNKAFLALGHKNLYTSIDAKNWEKIPLDKEHLTVLQQSQKPVYCEKLGMFATLAGPDSTFQRPTNVITSSDGINWQISVGLKNFSGEIALASLTALEKGFLLSAVGAETSGIYRTQDGKEWKIVNQEVVFDLFYYQGFVFGNRQKHILVSKDNGENWQISNPTLCSNPIGWAAAGEQVISIGMGGCVAATSLDDIFNTTSWIRSQTGIDVVSDFTTVNGNFLLMGAVANADKTESWGQYAMSADGVFWKKFMRDFANEIADTTISYGNQMVVSMGRKGFIAVAYTKQFIVETPVEEPEMEDEQPISDPKFFKPQYPNILDDLPR